MNKIMKLPSDLVNRIAAGEVVERPASVLKELLENSLDAGATELDIVIEGAGRVCIRVSDNGCGMSADDALLCLERHATSKISRYEDLESVGTFGFRGEALPSTAAVSRLSLTTKTEQAATAWRVAVDGGAVVGNEPAARETGTTIEVKDLFFNTPARYKFLKSDNTERAQCVKVIEDIVFSVPSVKIRLQLEKTKPQVFSAAPLKDRIAQAWGARWQPALEPVEAASTHFSLKGYVTHQAHHQATSRSQVLFVNRRPVLNRRLARAVYDAYVGQLPQGRHPGWVLFLEVNPQTVDVNVHPTKREVKLAFEGEIYQFMLNSIREALRKTVAVPAASLGASHFAGATQQLETLYRPLPPLPPQAASEGVATAPSSLLSLMAGAQSGQTEFMGFKDQALFAVAQLHDMFIVSQSVDSVVLVDQHAAHEKVLYEKLLKNYLAATPQVQMLLVPFPWEVAVSLAPLIKGKLPSLQKMGFVIEDFGGDTFLVKGYPSLLGEKFDLHSLLDGMTDVMADPDDPRGGFERNFDHRLACITACKAAVKAGDSLDLKVCQHILHELALCDDPLTCPHGRPTVIRFSLSELERRFRRR